MTHLDLSFEFFPPKDSAGLESLQRTAKELAVLNPVLMTVTCGAGGTTVGSPREGTLNALRAVRQVWPGPIAAHLTYAGQQADDLERFADRLWTEGVSDLVALRGDLPHPLLPLEDPAFPDTAHFVAALKARHPFTVHVGAYPEKHPESATQAHDILTLKSKQTHGADDALTQFFFDADSYETFVALARAAGVTIPIIPGLLPIYDWRKTCAFAEKCGTKIPDTLQSLFENVRSPEESASKAATFLKDQIGDLSARGVTRFHLYTLNRADIILRALKTL